MKRRKEAFEKYWKRVAGAAAAHVPQARLDTDKIIARKAWDSGCRYEEFYINQDYTERS